MNITIVGIGYVGLSMTLILSRKHHVFALDTDIEKINALKQKIAPVQDQDAQNFIDQEKLNFVACSEQEQAFIKSDYIIVSTPTDYDEQNNYFDTYSVESVITNILSINSTATIIIKSTIPVGFTQKMRQRYSYQDIYFSPEFLREGKALHDNLYPSRIIIGGKTETAKQFAQILRDCSNQSKTPILLTNSAEAEAIKLFANTYLAMRIAYFNELDTYCDAHRLNSREVIQGVGLDHRIGQHYNNPSFGYGGYCLPKDTKQLLANFQDIPNELIASIVSSNETRKEFIVENLLQYNVKTIGIYRLIMKSGSDNFRSSAIQGIIRRLICHDIQLIIFEPQLTQDSYLQCPVINDLEQFKLHSELIVANRLNDELSDVMNKVYTRDLFGHDA